VVGIVVVAAACTSGPAAETSTTSGQTPLTTLAADGTTATTSQSTTTTTQARELTPPRYRIVDRIEGDGESKGDTVVVLLDPASYDSLTDIDLFDIIAEVVELFPPISVIHIVDDPGAANAVANPDASNAEIQAIQANYLARLDDGLKITYLGPFASSGTAVLGS